MAQAASVKISRSPNAGPFQKKIYGFRALDWLVGLIVGFLFDLMVLGPIVLIIDIRSFLRKSKKPEEKHP